MKDVARLAGVSYQTVSNVINEEPHVTDETRQRVLAAIEELGYQPHAAGRSLRSGKSRIIGLMIPDAQNPHFWETVKGAEDEANKHGYSILLSTTSMDQARERKAFDTLLRQQLDAIIPLFTYPEDFIDDLKRLRWKNFPVATSYSGAPMPEILVDVVWAHYENAAEELMEHLLGLGHRRIAMIWGVGRSELANDRVNAYHKALRNVGLPFRKEYLVSCGFSLEESTRAAEQLMMLDPLPTAIVGINDLMAFGAMQVVMSRGLRIPEDISIAGFDDLPMASILHPPLTTGKSDGYEIGKRCVQLVLDRIKDPERSQQVIHVSTSLVIRGSTGFCQEKLLAGGEYGHEAQRNGKGGVLKSITTTTTQP